MKILLASSEIHPYSKTGGLADMVGALAKTLAHSGNRVGVVTPLHRGIREKYPDVKKADWYMDLLVGSRRIQGELWIAEPAPNLTIYFVHQPEFFQRAGLYQEHGIDYPDNAERFIFFAKAIIHLARYL